MVMLRRQRKMAAVVLRCGKSRIWMDPNECNEIKLANSRKNIRKMFKKIDTDGSKNINREEFEPAAIRKASVACEAMCMWTRAMYKYHFVAKAVDAARARDAAHYLGYAPQISALLGCARVLQDRAIRSDQPMSAPPPLPAFCWPRLWEQSARLQKKS